MGKAKIPGLKQAQQFGEQFLLWGVMMQIAQTALAPVWAELQQKAFEIAPDLPLALADLVDATIKGHLTEAAAAGQAKLSGLDPERFATLIASAGEPPGPATLLELWRRGIIPEASGGADGVSVEQGIREGRTKNKWIEPLKALKTELPSPADALAALLEGQTDHETALKLYQQWGGDPRYFELMFNTRGSAPTPLEAAQMARRGIIPWDGNGPGVVSFEQAFLEGPWRNKWLDAYREVSNYIPPPRTVVALVRAGAITDQQGQMYLEQDGVKPDLAAAYIAEAHQSKTETTRQLTATNIAALYAEKALSEPEALAALEKIGYTASDAALELELASARTAQSQLNSALGRVRSLYVAHHISEQQVLDSLGQLQVEPSQATHLLATWKLERGLAVHTLTTAEVASAVYYQLLTEEEGLKRLEELGYGPLDAWTIIGIRLHGPPKMAKPSSNVPAI